jgi:hypothetical protein
MFGVAEVILAYLLLIEQILLLIKIFITPYTLFTIPIIYNIVTT